MNIETLTTDLAQLAKLCHAGNFDDLSGKAKCAAIARLVQMQDQLHGLTMKLTVDADNTRAYAEHKSRSLTLRLAADQHMNHSSAGRVVNQAHVAIERIPLVHDAYVEGRLSRDQFNLLTRVAEDPKFRKIVGDHQDFFLSLAGQQYAWFRSRVEAWCEENDPTDPHDLDAKAHDDRKLVWAQGLGRTMIGELNLPNIEYDQLMNVLDPIYDTLMKTEFREAAEAAGLDPELSDADRERKLCTSDLARTGPQRWIDALMIAMRAAGVVSRPALEKLARGETLSIDDIDPGAVVGMVIVCDQETIEREIQRQNGVELEPRSGESLSNRRCETLSGRPISPETALMLAQIGAFRRMVMAPNDLDFTSSRSARFFTGALREGLIIRDRFCATPGCSVPAHKCEADHLEQAAHDGDTLPVNARMRCPGCHRHKTRLQSLGLWKEPTEDGGSPRVQERSGLEPPPTDGLCLSAA